jgi:hypothetical protein
VPDDHGPRLQEPGLGIGLAPNFMGLEIGIFCDFLYSILLFNAILGLDFLGLALSRP